MKKRMLEWDLLLYRDSIILDQSSKYILKYIIDQKPIHEQTNNQNKIFRDYLKKISFESR